MAYGWPQVISLDPGLPSSSSERVVYLKSTNRLLLIVGPTHLELWSTSQHRLRLGKYVREEKSVAIEGENARAVWSPDTKTVAVLTTAHFLHIYKIQLTGKRLLIGGKQYPSLFLASISLTITEAIPLFEDCLAVSNFVCDNKSTLIGLSNGHLRLISWNAEVLTNIHSILFLFVRDYHNFNLISLFGSSIYSTQIVSGYVVETLLQTYPRPLNSTQIYHHIALVVLCKILL
jgi:hypothetical protein